MCILSSALKRRRVCLYPGLIIGAVVDGILQLVSGDEGNLLDPGSTCNG